MTVNYMRPAATAHASTFLALLFRWRGSVWKHVFLELSIWLSIYLILSAAYRFFMLGTLAGEIFEVLVKMSGSLESDALYVVTFAMGFYFTQIASRWWTVFMMIPWPDEFAFNICAYVRPRSNRDRKTVEDDQVTQKTVMRYLALTYTLAFRDISTNIRKRMPTLDHLVPSLMTEDEKEMIRTCDAEQRKVWLPIEWAVNLLKKCHRNQQIDDYHFTKMIATLLRYRERLHNVMQYDWVNVPLAYTQAVNMSVLLYFLFRAVSAQAIANENAWGADAWLRDSVIPIYAMFEFIFFVGWLKSAQVMLNPFGMDDDDFEMDVIIERNLQVSYACVDTMYETVPPLVDLKMRPLPHTVASAAALCKGGQTPMRGSAAVLKVPKEEQRIVSQETMDKLRKTQEPNPTTNAHVALSPKRTQTPSRKEFPKQNGNISKGTPRVSSTLHKVPAGTPAEPSGATGVRNGDDAQLNQVADQLHLLNDVQKRRQRLDGQQLDEDGEAWTQSESHSMRYRCLTPTPSEHPVKSKASNVDKGVEEGSQKTQPTESIRNTVTNNVAESASKNMVDKLPQSELSTQLSRPSTPRGKVSRPASRNSSRREQTTPRSASMPPSRATSPTKLENATSRAEQLQAIRKIFFENRQLLASKDPEEKKGTQQKSADTTTKKETFEK